MCFKLLIFLVWNILLFIEGIGNRCKCKTAVRHYVSQSEENNETKRKEENNTTFTCWNKLRARGSIKEGLTWTYFIPKFGIQQKTNAAAAAAAVTPSGNALHGVDGRPCCIPEHCRRLRCRRCLSTATPTKQTRESRSHYNINKAVTGEAFPFSSKVVFFSSFSSFVCWVLQWMFISCVCSFQSFFLCW